VSFWELVRRIYTREHPFFHDWHCEHPCCKVNYEAHQYLRHLKPPERCCNCQGYFEREEQR
jgi:hypothetical protein